VHGVRHAAELAYRERLAALQTTPPVADCATRLRIIGCITREPIPPEREDLLAGRITTLLENAELEKRAGVVLAPEKSRVMLCGNPEMTAEMRLILKQRGMRPCRRVLTGQFVAENYW
jgi:ferredoxin--NADP+ reductase